MLAKAFSYYDKYDDIVIFASGVSNSQEANPYSFNRELNLLSNTILHNKDKTIVYFSTCSIDDSSVNKSYYVQHKINIEEYIKKYCKKFYIFRLPQVVGQADSPTLVNFLYLSITNDIKININLNSTRNIIDANDILPIVQEIIHKAIYINEITNIATPYNILVYDIVLKLEKLLSKKANISLVEKGQKMTINVDKIKLLHSFNKISNSEYTDNVLIKYIREKNAIKY